MKERTPQRYHTMILYTAEETGFSTVWLFFGRRPLLVHRERFIWIDGYYFAIPTEDATRFFFSDEYVLIRKNDTVTIGVKAHADTQ